MPSEISVLKLDEISLVDHPANGDARVTIAKRKEPSMADEKKEPATDGGEDVTKREDADKIEKADLLKRLDEQDQVIKGLRAEQEMVALEKRAADELPNITGAPRAKAELFKAAEGIDGGLDILKGADAAYASMTKEIGTAGETVMNSNAEKLDEMAAAHAAAHNVTKAHAYGEVIKTEEGRALFAKRNEG